MKTVKAKEIFDAALTIFFSILFYIMALTEDGHTLLFTAWSAVLVIGAVCSGSWVLFTINEIDSWEDDGKTIPSAELVMKSALGRIFYLLLLIMMSISDLTLHSFLWGFSGFLISLAILCLVTEVYNFMDKELHLDLKIFKINIVPRYKKEREELKNNIDNTQD